MSHPIPTDMEEAKVLSCSPPRTGKLTRKQARRMLQPTDLAISREVYRWMEYPTNRPLLERPSPSTALYAIQEIEHLREWDGSVNALLEDRSAELCPTLTPDAPSRLPDWTNGFLNSLAAEILRRLLGGATVLDQASISVAGSATGRTSMDRSSETVRSIRSNLPACSHPFARTF